MVWSREGQRQSGLQFFEGEIAILLSADGFGTQRSLLLLAWANPVAHEDRVNRSKENHTGRAGKTVWALGERASARGEKRGDLIGRGSIKPSYDLMEEQISETNLSAGWRSAWNPELLRPHLTGLGCLYRGWLRVQPQNRGSFRLGRMSDLA